MHKPKNLFPTLFIASALLSVSGCTSKPREVSASIALVTYSTEKPDEKVVPEQYWSKLAEPSLRTFAHPEYQIQMSALYISALGERCRELEIVDKRNRMQKRIACELHFIDQNKKQDKAWFLEKEIIESASYVEL